MRADAETDENRRSMEPLSRSPRVLPHPEASFRGRRRLALRAPRPRGGVAVAVVSRPAAASPGEADEVLAGRCGDSVAAAMHLLVDGEAGVFSPEEWRRTLLGVIATRPAPAPDGAPEPVRAAYIDGQLAMRERMTLRAVECLRDRHAQTVAGPTESAPLGPLPASRELFVLCADGTVVADAPVSRLWAVTRWALAAAVQRETPLMILDLRSMTSYSVTVDGCQRVCWRPAGRGWVLQRVDVVAEGARLGDSAGVATSRVGCSA